MFLKRLLLNLEDMFTVNAWLNVTIIYINREIIQYDYIVIVYLLRNKETGTLSIFPIINVLTKKREKIIGK